MGMMMVMAGAMRRMVMVVVMVMSVIRPVAVVMAMHGDPQ
jgi:hypothetical protein